MYNDPDKTAYIDSLILESKHFAPPEPMNCSVDAKYVFFMERTPIAENLPACHVTAEDSPNDYDNIEKSLNDSLVKAGFLSNDKRIVHWEGWKLWAEPDLFPRILVWLKPFDNKDLPKFI